MKKIIEMFTYDPAGAVFRLAIIVVLMMTAIWLIPHVMASSIMGDPDSFLAILGGTQERLEELFRGFILITLAYLFLKDWMR